MTLAPPPVQWVASSRQRHVHWDQAAILLLRMSLFKMTKYFSPPRSKRPPKAYGRCQRHQNVNKRRNYIVNDPSPLCGCFRDAGRALLIKQTIICQVRENGECLVIGISGRSENIICGGWGGGGINENSLRAYLYSHWIRFI